MFCHPELVSGSFQDHFISKKPLYLHLAPNSTPTMPKRFYHNYWVYILASKPRGILYIGFTGGIDDRMERHMRNEGSKFTAKYNVKQLVYFEEFQYVGDAIPREKQLKNWHREWKINLIEESNPNWDNLWKPLGDLETRSG